MFRPDYLQDRLNGMILAPDEVEAFKVQRDQYTKTNLTLAAQEKFEAARQASVDLLKSFFTPEQHETAKIDAQVLANHLGQDAPKQQFGTKR